ncbi:MAG: hypothetical protein ACXWOL_03380 [Ktedonobacteraceae bacterium]
MNVVELLERYKQAPVSSERTFPAYPFPRKYVHCVIDSLEDAVKAVFALRVAGCATEDIHVMASWDFVEAFERLHQRKKGFYKVLKRLYAFMDEGLPMCTCTKHARVVIFFLCVYQGETN